MAFFQNSVINKYIQNLDKQTLQNAYAKFRAHFHNATIQENIRGSKEEQYQGEFLIDLFVNVLGYTKNPTPNFNLTTEYKNVKDSKKADGAIIIKEIVKAVIELKGTNTTDLNKIEVQAFGYKNNQPECEYVITSNFEKIRFYIDNAIEYLEFNLFTLTEKEFELLYICLSYESIAKGLPKQIKDESVSQESLITKKLYNDYSQFKNELYHNLVKLNPQYEPLELFKKSQKLLDRFLFIFFAEDRQLLPTNLIFRINKEWQQLRNMRIAVSLYDRYKIYFNDLDCGATVSLPAFSQTASKQVEEFQIYAYNGGLFKHDDLLNDVKIDDDLLFTHTEKLSNYDFASEVDVNVLGHIFENSLNDVDEIKAQLDGQEIDKTKTKRKKDGVFYTPKYITKYIVDNTVGKLCLEKKEALQLTESDYTIDKKRQKKTTQALTDKLNEYRNWLLQLTICDPACGSGAFLNQALDFLITEHRYIDELQAKLFGDALVLSDVEGSILENNLFGVDINEESVEIAKLSLWLRTAQPNRKLNDLNSNIKCGNSLIDDVAVAGDKAFNWQNEFIQVFAKGGFDAVIGNPPYVNLSLFPKEVHNYLQVKYTSIHTGYNDLMYYFLYKGISMLKNDGIFGVITSNYFIGNDYAKNLRKFLTLHIDSIINFENYFIFEDANVHSTILLALPKPKSKNILFSSYISNDKLKEIVLSTDKYRSAILNRDELLSDWIVADDKQTSLINKIKRDKDMLETITEIAKGSESGKNEIFNVGKEVIDSYSIEKEVLRKCVKNSNIDSYFIKFENRFIIYADNNFSKESFPNAYRYLEERKSELLDRRGPKTGEYDWWRFHRPSVKEVFDAPEKIIVPYRADKNRFGYDNKQYFNDGGDIRALRIIDSRFAIKYVVSVLNSKLINWYYGFIGKPKGNSREYFNKPLSLIPVKNISSSEQLPFIEKADIMLNQSEALQSIKLEFLKFVTSKFKIETPSVKLQNWNTLDFNDFIKELAKLKIKLNAEDEFNFMSLFEKQKQQANNIQSIITNTDNEINKMVYKLYELTEEEIKIVEG